MGTIVVVANIHGKEIYNYNHNNSNNNNNIYEEMMSMTEKYKLQYDKFNQNYMSQYSNKPANTHYVASSPIPIPIPLRRLKG